MRGNFIKNFNKSVGINMLVFLSEMLKEVSNGDK
jgi:hypothetical protein